MNPQQEKMLREVHEAVIGNPNTGNLGILVRVAKLERITKQLQGKILASSGIVAGVLAAWEVYKQVRQ